MKYIDAGKLKYEIKRRKLSNYYIDTDDYETELFEIIDSLQQEQQEVDLERDAVQCCFDKGLNLTPYQAKTIASYFYELGKNSK
jgi:hypothetical protein